MGWRNLGLELPVCTDGAYCQITLALVTTTNAMWCRAGLTRILILLLWGTAVMVNCQSAAVNLRYCKCPVLNLFLFWNVAVRSTDSGTIFDEKFETQERSTKRWRKKRSMYQATDSADSLSESEVSCLPFTMCFFLLTHFCNLGSMCNLFASHQ